MNIYRLLRLAGSRRVPRFVKLMGLWSMHVTGRRYIAIYFDPVMACNLRCRMCLFSGEKRRNEAPSRVSDSQLDIIQKTFFGRALNFQIGCSAEPTLDKRLPDIISRAYKAGIPHIALITNGQLIASGAVDIDMLVVNGLNELTISMHGTRRQTYEHLMPGADFDKLHTLLDNLKEIKDRHPEFKIRVNFTVNSMNMHDLERDRFFDLWPEGLLPDVVQLRPVQNLGDSDWKDFDMHKLADNFDATIGHVVELCRQKGILCLAPNRQQLSEVSGVQDGISALIEDATYYYISPNFVYKEDFELGEDTFASYHKRKHTARHLFCSAFSSSLRSRNRKITKKLNYQIK